MFEVHSLKLSEKKEHCRKKIKKKMKKIQKRKKYKGMGEKLIQKPITDE